MVGGQFNVNRIGGGNHIAENGESGIFRIAPLAAFAFQANRCQSRNHRRKFTDEFGGAIRRVAQIKANFRDVQSAILSSRNFSGAVFRQKLAIRRVGESPPTEISPILSAVIFLF